MKKILLTGGSGYIGSVVLRDLLQRDYEVVVFDNLERGHRRNIPLCVKFIHGDLRDANAIKTALINESPDAVMHFAAYALVGESMANPLMYFSNNVKGGINLLEGMQAVGCSRLIFSSSCATYGVPERLPIEEGMNQNPTNPYGQSKLMFEQMCRWYEMRDSGFVLRPTFLRYFNAAGAAYGMVEDHEPETHIIPNVINVALGKTKCVKVFGNDYPTPDGTCVRDYVHLKDLSSAHILALEKDVTGAFNLGVGHGTSVMEIIEACKKVTKQDILIEFCQRRPGDPPALYASGAKAREELGWNPLYSDIETIVADAWEAHKTHPLGYKK